MAPGVCRGAERSVIEGNFGVPDAPWVPVKSL